MNIISPTYPINQKPIRFKSTTKNTTLLNQPVEQDELNTQNNKKKKKQVWTYLAIGTLILALITDIIIEHNLRMTEKAQKKEKELLEESIKKLKEESKKLEEQIQKKKNEINDLKNNTTPAKNNSPEMKPPKIDLDSPEP